MTDPIADTPARARDLVQLTLPPDGAYLSVLRTATASLAARLHFTLDEIEDLRMAVDEACVLLLSQALAGTDVRVNFEVREAELQVDVSVLTRGGAGPDKETFGWTVLDALVTDLSSDVDADRRVTISLTKRRADTP